jgi:type I restriction enzyme S subunit
VTPQQLKNSILQMAMQGKLVEQRPEEGTGEELYRQIQKEKQKLIKEGKIKKQKQLPEITEDEVPFEIPESWKWVRINEIANTSLGKTLNKSTDKGDVVPYLCSINIRDGEIDLTQLKSALFSPEEQNKYRLAPGDLLICEGGDVGKAAIWNSDSPMCYQNALHRVRFFIEGLSDFYRVMLEYYKGIGLITRVSKGVTIKHFVQASLYSLCCPLPPLAEQKRIAAKIEEIMPFIDRYAMAYEHLQSYNTRFPDDLKKSILQMAIQGKLVPQDPNDEPASALLEKISSRLVDKKGIRKELDFEAMDFSIPDSWEWTEVNQIFNFVDYRGKTPHKIHDGVFLITASNIKDGYMDYTRKEYISEKEYGERQSRGITHRGDILFTTEAPMGNAALCEMERCSCGQRIITFQPYRMNTVIPKLFMYFILSPSFQKQLLDNCTGTTAKGIKAEKLRYFLIPLPPIAEQKRIVAKLDELLPQIDGMK